LFTRRPATLKAFASSPATIQPSARSLGAACRTVLVCVRDEEQLSQAVFEDGLLDAMSPGDGLVINSTISPRTARRVAEAAAPAGVDVLDAPVSGGPAGASQGTLSIMVGGDPEAFQRHRGVLDDLGSVVELVGDTGAGSALKLINNAAYATHLSVAVAVTELAERFGIAPSVAASMLTAGSGDSWALRRLAGSSFSLDLSGTPGADHVIALLEKDVRLLRSEGAAQTSELAELAGAAVTHLAQTDPTAQGDQSVRQG
jgi:3-hydroxyisobutyrate dehydrogenase-like beta-hydroxyacid dehydrogenase